MRRRRTLTDWPRYSAAERKLPRRTTSRNIRMLSQSGVAEGVMASRRFTSGTRLCGSDCIRSSCGLSKFRRVSRRPQLRRLSPMTAHDRNITFAAQPILPSPRKLGRRLDDLGTQKLAKRLVVFMPRGCEIDALVAHVRKDLSGVARSDVVRRVV